MQKLLAAKKKHKVHWQRRSRASVDVKDPLSLCGIPRFRRPSLDLPKEWSKRDPVGIRERGSGTWDPGAGIRERGSGQLNEWSKRNPVPVLFGDPVSKRTGSFSGSLRNLRKEISCVKLIDKEVTPSGICVFSDS